MATDMKQVRLVAMGGEPATGKTTIFKLLRARFPLVTRVFDFGLVKGLANADMSTIFIGVYDGSTFEGSDRLSMAVQPVFERMLVKLISQGKPVTIYLEGDRLFNPSLCDKFTVLGLVIEASPENLTARHRARNDNQSETFIKAKRTKYARIVDSFKFPKLPNNTESEQAAIVEWLVSQHHAP